jgi:nitrogen fixation/metabolism regulation signal transduction histidine kinase
MSDEEMLSKLRHDIKNQLSNIHMALETLRYETPNPSEDFTFCMETIFSSAAKINELLTEAQ